MRVLFDICHPAHVHFFRFPISKLIERGHEVLVTSRKKESALDLLDSFEIPHTCISEMGSGGVAAFFKELLIRNSRLVSIQKKFKADVFAGIGGIFIAQVGAITRTPSLVFYDTENAKLQNLLTYPFASCILVPRCYAGKVIERKTVRYAGYHELSYLRPGYFHPDKQIALENGLAPSEPTFFIRVVSWKASHDIGETGWNHDLLSRLVKLLGGHGRVLISSERPLPGEFSKLLYSGKTEEVHHLMAFCRGFVGESATMASECAVLGVPAVYAAETGRGYTDEQEAVYGVVRNVRELTWPELQESVIWLLEQSSARRQRTLKTLLDDTIDVAQFVVDSIEKYPRVLHDYPRLQSN